MEILNLENVKKERSAVVLIHVALLSSFTENKGTMAI